MKQASRGVTPRIERLLHPNLCERRRSIAELHGRVNRRLEDHCPVKPGSLITQSDDD
jgi:hypothetical protein